jgi:transketolase N-terminal domain/subunit
VSAANYGLHEIVAVVDHNKIQSDSFVANVSDLGDLEARAHLVGGLNAAMGMMLRHSPPPWLR